MSLGKCTHCNSVLNGKLKHKPAENGTANFICIYSGNFNLSHPTNLHRPLKGENRKNVVEQMTKENISASAYRKRKANEMMSDNDPLPSHLPSENVLRVAKCEDMKKKRLDDNPIIAIAKAMHEGPFCNIIRDVSYDKFKVYYSSPAQRTIYTNYCKTVAVPKLSIDATGGLFQYLYRTPKIKSGPIFLYNAVVHDKVEKKILTVNSLISESHTTETIRHWLTEWLQKSKINELPRPKEICMDMSIALISGTIQAFTNFPSLAAYLQECGKIIDGKLPSLPSCYIRTDVCHLVSLLTKWSSLRDKPKRTRQFYIRAMCQVIQSDNLNDIKKLLKDIVTVALSESEGEHEETGMPIPCEISKQNLLQRIGGSTTNLIEGIDGTNNIEKTEQASVNQDMPDYEDEEYLSYKKTAFYYWLVEIIEEFDHETGSKGLRGNQQWLPELVKDLLNLAPLIPLWTAVMVPYYGYGEKTAASSAVECSFKDLKNVLFREKQFPMRVDDFVFDHIRVTEGDMKLIGAHKTMKDKIHLSETQAEADNATQGVKDKNHYAENANQNQGKVKDKHVTWNLDDSAGKATASNDNEFQKKEDWMGQVSKSDKRKRKSFLETNSEWLHMDLSEKKQIMPIKLLRNGNVLQSVQINKHRYQLLNTCGFDTLVQILASSYCDSTVYNDYMKEVVNFPTSQLAMDIIHKNVTAAAYKKRAEILKSQFPSEKKGGVTFVSCQSSISIMVENVFSENPTIIETSVCPEKNCPDPTVTSKRYIITISEEQYPLNRLQEGVEDFLQTMPSYCKRKLEKDLRRKCKGLRQRTCQITSPHLLIEIISYSNNNLRQITLIPEDVPATISVEGKRFFLRGLVEYQNHGVVDSATDIGHYVAICCRDGQYEEYNDLENKPIFRSGKREVLTHLLFFTEVS